MSNETEKLNKMCYMLDEIGLSDTSKIIMDLYDQVRQQSDDVGMLTAQNDKLIREVEGLEAMINAERDFG
mgnify:CR=1 FL=1